MTFSHRREPLLLLLGDVIVLYFSLWAMLAARYWNIPDEAKLQAHLLPFTFLFAVWIGVFFIAGLYEKHTSLLKGRIGSLILNTQLVNSFIAVLFFYLIPYFGITPKTNLFIYLVFSFLLLFAWRVYLFPSLEVTEKQNAILIGTGEEMKELEEEVNNNTRYNLYFISSLELDEIGGFDFQEEILKRIYAENVHIIAADFRSEKVEPLLPSLYNLIFSQVRFIDMHKIYEDIFDRVPLSLVKYSWFLENISGAAQKSYDILKRAMDIMLALILGIISLLLYPLVVIAIKLDDGGPILFWQERVGQNNKIFKVVKFRSLKSHNDPEGIAKSPQPTKVGKFLRRTRIDELPQVWNVLKGNLSMIGPRPEIPSLVKHYEKEIPYYNVRHLIKPGLSGWAQLYGEHAHHATNVSQTKNKLSYDLYYIKNRSLTLDLKVALRTIKILLSREGI
ncbi:exopolysaccharide biosynthesis polyprenyl glycosylphosphotransferase [Patescibacteria group bacterium]|nr:MAG: exopolysaccharide biosynthesis polyprenyl glycosylphosphotransferase [Patescibacteria group bacterium]